MVAKLLTGEIEEESDDYLVSTGRHSGYAIQLSG